MYRGQDERAFEISYIPLRRELALTGCNSNGWSNDFSTQKDANVSLSDFVRFPINELNRMTVQKIGMEERPMRIGDGE